MTRSTVTGAWWGLVLGIVVLIPSLVAIQGCTDLDEDLFSSVTDENFFQTEGEAFSAVASVYAQMRDMLWAYHNLSQHSSDETLVPVRGTDWDDAGRWRSMHKHTWDPLLVDFNDAWVGAATGVTRSNTVITAIRESPGDIPGRDQLISELRFLRAFYYFQLLDFFGNVPVVDETSEEELPQQSGRSAVFAFVESELQDVRSDLPHKSELGSAGWGRASVGAADALLARLYLNAEILSGALTAGGITRGTARWSEAIASADAVINSGEYDLAGDYLDNFRVDNHTSPELIFVTPTLAKNGLGLTFVMRTLHYNQIPQTPWNGFIALADVFNSFDPDDRRADVFLVGQMYEQPNSGCIGNECFSNTSSGALEDRKGNPLVFTPGLFTPDGTPVTGEPINVDESSGVRVLKWEIDPNRTGENNGNDFAWLRLAEMYLIKAEAAYRQGNSDEALASLNMLRDRAFGGDPSKRLTAVDEDVILHERQYELLWESVRRQDLIRFDRFTTASWEFKAQSAPHRNVFPIPQVQLDANPNLVQNPGY